MLNVKYELSSACFSIIARGTNSRTGRRDRRKVVDRGKHDGFAVF